MLMLAGITAVVIGVGSAPADPPPRVAFQPGVIGLFRRASVAVTGLSAHTVEARLRGATDEAGLAYEWTPYRWRRLSLSHGAWRGALPSPALLGVYQLQLRLDGRHSIVQSRGRLLRVFRPATPPRQSFPTPIAVIRNFVERLPGHQELVARRRFAQAAFDHRDPRLHRIYAVAYAPRGDKRVNSRLGLFVTVVREGFRGRWHLLEEGIAPYD